MLKRYNRHGKWRVSILFTSLFSFEAVCITLAGLKLGILLYKYPVC